MAEAGTKSTGGNTAVPQHGDHDRVVMLSLRADGTPDQHNPEIIGDKDVALAAAKQQFAEQAVSAADVQRTRKTVTEAAGESPQDPSIEKAKAELEKAQSAGEKAAEKTVSALTSE